jgi:hypothetical protein
VDKLHTISEADDLLPGESWCLENRGDRQSLSSDIDKLVTIIKKEEEHGK